MLFLARWARRLSWKETAEAFRTSWDKVFDAVEHATRGSQPYPQEIPLAAAQTQRKSLQDEQHFRLRDLLRYNLKIVRAYLLKEALQQLWDCFPAGSLKD